ncbi:hypothetical protein TREMTM_A_00030 [Candidatus Tremblaya princeps]|uniref:Uncharacterized protein n=1 Tax=Tremblaya princeps TaxID=189385 RepID=A0A1C3K8T5_TREPR|nr:hypothetical protein TREMTM_A_00030 [Candidatus Tremblaya princeps]
MTGQQGVWSSRPNGSAAKACLTTAATNCERLAHGLHADHANNAFQCSGRPAWRHAGLHATYWHTIWSAVPCLATAMLLLAALARTVVVHDA